MEKRYICQHIAYIEKSYTVNFNLKTCNGLSETCKNVCTKNC